MTPYKLTRIEDITDQNIEFNVAIKGELNNELQNQLFEDISKSIQNDECERMTLTFNLEDALNQYRLDWSNIFSNVFKLGFVKFKLVCNYGTVQSNVEELTKYRPIIQNYPHEERYEIIYIDKKINEDIIINNKKLLQVEPITSKISDSNPLEQAIFSRMMNDMQADYIEMEKDYNHLKQNSTTQENINVMTDPKESDAYKQLLKQYNQTKERLDNLRNSRLGRLQLKYWERKS